MKVILNAVNKYFSSKQRQCAGILFVVFIVADFPARLVKSSQLVLHFHDDFEYVFKVAGIKKS